MARSSSGAPGAAQNAFAGMSKGSAAYPSKGSSSDRDSAGNPREDAADRKGDQMRPMNGPAGSLNGGVDRPVGQAMRKSPGRDMGRGHMGDWADRVHPAGRGRGA